MLGGINAVIVGNYLTTLGRSPEEDLALLGDLGMPVKALSADALRSTANPGHAAAAMRAPWFQTDKGIISGAPAPAPEVP